MRNQLFIYICTLLGIFQIKAQSPAGNTLFDLLYQPDSQLEVALQCQWDTLLSLRNTNREVDGVFFFQKSDGQMEEWDVHVSVRGKFRRRICDFPPIKLDFSKKDLRKAGMLPFDKMKLVTHCLEDPNSDDRIFREHILYQMYQHLSLHALQTQLVQIKYVDSGRAEPFTLHAGILIEDDQVLANRLGLDRVDTLYLAPHDFPAYHEEVHALFQYLIGNTDWSLQMSRNLELLKDTLSEQFFLIPYDFDFSGFVNAPYAIPNPDYDLKSLQQRVYLGESPPSAQARQMILSRKKPFMQMIRKSPFLSSDAKYECINYLSDGFREIKRNKLSYPETE